MKHARTAVRLSRPGKVFVGLTLALGFAAVNSGNNVLFLLVSMMLALMVLSGMVALLNLKGVQVRIVPQQILEAQRPGALLVAVDNHRPWPLLMLELRLTEGQTLLPYLPAHGQARLALPWQPPLRGHPPLPLLRVGSAFPFAFVWRGQDLDLTATGPWVAPAASPAGIKLQEEGRVEETVGKPGGSGDFLGVRDRLPGEGLSAVLWRRVDWALRAQGEQRLPARERERGGEHLIIFDWEAPALAEMEPERRLQVLRRGLDDAVAAGQAWQLRMPGGRAAGVGRVAYEAALLLLAQQPPLPVYAPAAAPPAPWWRFRRAS
ncbi:MAG: hypothetical protein M1488_06970 [Gammaproteobacteria bacterium]|nr:hypothetical protein [Gammaproteobacteria bacterium]